MVIAAQGVQKRYGATTAVASVDLAVAPGEILAVLGPNGAGKTTMMDILTGRIDRDGGDVTVLGVDPRDFTGTHRARMGIVGQTSSSFEALTVGEIVEHFAAFYPESRRDPVRAVELVELTVRYDARVSTLSGGQRRRLDVALAIVGQPELLFLDEPTVGFDPASRRSFWRMIRALAAAGTTIVLTTHYLDEADALADRVAVLLHGRVAEIAAPAALRARIDGRATVSWRGPTGIESIVTHSPTATVRELAEQFGGEVPELAIGRPTLEEAYLELVGTAS